MNAPHTRRQFGPEATARRARKAEKKAGLKAAALEALDIGTPAPRFRSAIDEAIEETVATTSERVALKTAAHNRDPRATQAAQRALAARKVDLRQGQAAGQQQRRRPTIDEYLEGLSERQRDEIEQSAWFRGLDQRHQGDVLRRLSVLEEIEMEAERRLAEEDVGFAQDREDARIGQDEDDDEWMAGSDEAFEERIADARFASDSAAVLDDDWWQDGEDGDEEAEA